MFEQVNDIIIEKFKQNGRNTKDLRAKLEAVEKQYKSRLAVQRRAPGVIDNVKRRCGCLGHAVIEVVPAGDVNKYYIYAVIAYRPYNNSYTVWKYDSITDSLNEGVYNLNIGQALFNIGLDLTHVLKQYK